LWTDPNVDYAELEDVLADLVILTISAEVDRRSWPRIGGEGQDEATAWDLARRHTGSRREAEALVELGRARAAALVDQPSFVHHLEQLTDALIEHGELDAEQLRSNINGGSDGKEEH
jgi:hypothetical protein